MTAPLVIGLGFGLGSMMIVAGLRPLPTPLDDALERLRRPRVDLNPIASRRQGVMTALLGEALMQSSLGRRVLSSSASDLRVTETSPGEYLSRRVAFALTAALWAPLLFSV